MDLATALWHRIETIHAVTYFAPECAQAFVDVGLRGFWMGYFAGRAAPMGPVPAGVVTATFFNFQPAMVQRAIPDAWTFATPEAALDARASSAGAVLRRALPDVDDRSLRIVPLLQRAIDAATFEGRPLAAANAELEPAGDPVHELWQAATTLREHRGDGHVAILTSLGLGGCDVHVLQAAYRGIEPLRLQKARGWTEDDWRDSLAVMIRRGWMKPDGSLTDVGHAARTDIERRTDDLARAPFDALGEHAATLVELLAPVRDAVLAAEILTFPNPIGLPPT